MSQLRYLKREKNCSPALIILLARVATLFVRGKIPFSGLELIYCHVSCAHEPEVETVLVQELTDLLEKIDEGFNEVNALVTAQAKNGSAAGSCRAS